MFVRVLILFFFISCSADKYNWFNGTLDDALSSIDSNSEKLILLDFYADG